MQIAKEFSWPAPKQEVPADQNRMSPKEPARIASLADPDTVSFDETFLELGADEETGAPVVWTGTLSEKPARGHDGKTSFDHAQSEKTAEPDTVALQDESIDLVDTGRALKTDASAQIGFPPNSAKRLSEAPTSEFAFRPEAMSTDPLQGDAPIQPTDAGALPADLAKHAQPLSAEATPFRPSPAREILSARGQGKETDRRFPEAKATSPGALKTLVDPRALPETHGVAHPVPCIGSGTIRQVDMANYALQASSPAGNSSPNQSLVLKPRSVASPALSAISRDVMAFPDETNAASGSLSETGDADSVAIKLYPDPSAGSIPVPQAEDPAPTTISVNSGRASFSTAPLSDRPGPILAPSPDPLSPLTLPPEIRSHRDETPEMGMTASPAASGATSKTVLLTSVRSLPVSDTGDAPPPEDVLRLSGAALVSKDHPIGSASVTSDPLSNGPAKGHPSLSGYRELVLSQTSQAIVYAVSTERAQTTELTLSPDELGKLRFEITTKDDQTTIRVFAERSETLDLLRRSADALASELRQSGLTQGSLSFGSWNQRSRSNSQTTETGQGLEQRDTAPESVQFLSPQPLIQGRLHIRL